MATQGYCVKCKKKVEIQDPKKVVTKNKRNAVKGKCKCGTKVMAFVKG